MEAPSPPTIGPLGVNGGEERNPTALNPGASARLPSAEARLIEQLRQGDPEAGHQFARDYYPDVYRYLLYLTGRAEMAEDLAQETFLHAWRRLDTFEGRASLRVWLHRIAHREFLQALRDQRPQSSLEDVSELVPARDAEWVETVELREAIRKLPDDEREVVVLHYLQGYNCAEISAIVRAPVTTVKYRLSVARAHLQRELGEGDLIYLNEPGPAMRQWAWLPLEALTALEARVAMGDGGWLMVDGPAKSTPSPAPPEPSAIHHQPSAKKGARNMTDKNPTGMSRRKLLEAAGTAAAAAAAAGFTGPIAASPQNEADIVDSRLTRKVTLAFKAIALSDLCDRLQSDTGIRLAAGPSVADEKVSLFCEHTPLREVMRQLSRPFGYTWLRSRQASGVGRQALGETASDSNAQRPTPNASYRYELVQDLRSQLLEEELRNRDRNAALVALDREIARFQPYLHLSPDEALAKAKTAPAAEKPLLEKLSGVGWGPIQMDFRLSAQEQAALRSGQTLTFSQAPWAGELPLPTDIARGILQSFRYLRVHKTDDPQSPAIFLGGGAGEAEPGDLPLTEVSEVRTKIWLSLSQSELGQFTLDGGSKVFFPKAAGEGSSASEGSGAGPYAAGRSPVALQPDNHTTNVKLAAEPALRVLVTLQPQSSCGEAVHLKSNVATSRTGADGQPEREPKVTTADALEALHRDTGLPIISDFYTRLYRPEAAAMKNRPLFDVLDDLGDTMRLRWHRDSSWLQFRSTTFYDDRRKEVPNRLLFRWASSRRQQAGTREVGGLTLDELVEIAQLPNAELDGDDMAEGAQECWGLREWDLARSSVLRPHLRFLASFTPAQRQEAMSPAGLPFTRMTLAQQKQFIEHATLYDPLAFHELPSATMRVEYTQPGWFQWANPALAPHWMYYLVAVEPGRTGHSVPRPRVRERTREAAIEALHRLDPRIRERALYALHLGRQPDQSEPPVPLEAQVFPSELTLTFVYIPGASNAQAVHIIHRQGDNWQIPGS